MRNIYSPLLNYEVLLTDKIAPPPPRLCKHGLHFQLQNDTTGLNIYLQFQDDQPTAFKDTRCKHRTDPQQSATDRLLNVQIQYTMIFTVPSHCYYTNLMFK